MTHPLGITYVRWTRMVRPRSTPKCGDRRVTKKHGFQIRVFLMVRDTQGRIIGYDCTGGRQRYEWRSPAELVGTRFDYLIPWPRAWPAPAAVGAQS